MPRNKIRKTNRIIIRLSGGACVKFGGVRAVKGGKRLEKLTLGEIAAAVDGILPIGVDPEAVIDEISTDTRKIVKGCLFIALEGANFDGHDFIEKAFGLGAKAAISHKDMGSENGVVIKVKSTSAALLSLAGYYRRKFPVKLVGITGSVGKTSTKEMIFSVLRKRFKTLKTQGNLNNEVGLPLTLFGLDKSYQAAVIEMGMSHFDEISRLSQTASPDIGVITNVGVSHIENLGDRKGILKAKLEIKDGLSGEYPLILNADNDMLCNIGGDVMFYGIDSPGCDVRAENISSQDMRTSFDIIYDGGSYRAAVPAVGTHNVYNALAAFCVGVQLGIDINSILQGLSEYENTGMRQNIVNYGGITVIEDCYNASPDSMRASLDVLSSLGVKGKKIAVLGDMLELGSRSGEFHREIGKYAAKKADVLLCFGQYAQDLINGAAPTGIRAVGFDDKNELAQFLNDIGEEGDAVLIKASRGVRFEDVINKTYKESTKCL